MGQSLQSKRLRNLIRLLGGLQELHEKLRSLVEAKMDAMKRADVAAMSEVARDEKATAKRLAECEVSRRRLMEAMGKELGLTPQQGQALTVSQLASRLSESDRSILHDAAEKLREVASRLAQVNRVVGVLSREILNHLKWVFASVKPAGQQPVGYSGTGALVGTDKRRIFETVG